MKRSFVATLAPFALAGCLSSSPAPSDLDDEVLSRAQIGPWPQICIGRGTEAKDIADKTPSSERDGILRITGTMTESGAPRVYDVVECDEPPAFSFEVTSDSRRLWWIGVSLRDGDEDITSDIELPLGGRVSLIATVRGTHLRSNDQALVVRDDDGLLLSVNGTDDRALPAQELVPLSVTRGPDIGAPVEDRFGVLQPSSVRFQGDAESTAVLAPGEQGSVRLEGRTLQVLAGASWLWDWETVRVTEVFDPLTWLVWRGDETPGGSILIEPRD